MKRTILFLAAFVCCSLGVFAQTDLVATLSHGSKLTTYHGADGLSKAYDAAEAGDVITLSPGVFNAVNIEKAITVRGAGMMPLESNGYVSTNLSGDFTINAPTSSSSVPTLEGLLVLNNVNVNGESLAPVNLMKCRFQGGVTGLGIYMNATYCVFASRLYAKVQGTEIYSYRNTTLNCINCVINDAKCDGSYISSVGKIQATNCIVNAADYESYCTFNNCLILSTVGNTTIPLANTCSAHSCYGIDTNQTPDLFANINDTSNKMLEGSGDDVVQSVFKTLASWSYFSYDFQLTETFELTDAAAATYLGDDGKQVGIYGGPTPFNPVPNNPQVRKFVVDSSTESGKLKVKINVE